ncbi:MAG TPA: dephospho-CoA kinase [Lentimicrobium sp.]|nr:dephospho-CoA kinase [Lentimicrobium sp.]
MLKIGLTGSIGSGKSTIARVFSMLGVPVYLTDLEAKKILDLPEISTIVTDRFGNDLLDLNGILDRKKLASKVFNDHEALQWLNSLIHPRVRKHFLEWVDSHTAFPYIIQESAIMLETGFSSYFHKIVVVTCPLEERIKRVIGRDNMTQEQIIERMENQWSEELKIKKADFLIVNDDHVLAIPQVVRLHDHFLKMSLSLSE